MAKGPSVGTAWVTIALESKGVKPQIEKELAPVGEAAEKESKRAGDSLDSIGTKALAAAAIGSAALFGLASAAGGLNAALQTSDRVFGDASDSVKDFAADTSDAVFLSEEAALKAANAFGIFGTQAGMSKGDAADFSLEMVGLASDLAAVADVPVDQAIADLSSAFAGSTETMQKYGINLNETELKATYFAETGERISGVMTSQQKTMAVYWALLDKGSFAFGAAESEAGQFSAQLDRLKSVAGNVASGFGQPILDFATTLISTVSDKAQSILDFNDATGGMFATGIAASIGIATLVSGVVGAGSKLKSGIDKFKDLATWQKTATLATLGVGAALVAGFTIYGIMTQHQREIGENTRAAADALGDATQEAYDYAEAAAGATGKVDGLAVANRALAMVLTDENAEASNELRQALGDLGLQWEDAFDIASQWQDLQFNGDEVAYFADLGASMGLTAKQSAFLADTARDLDGSFNQLGSFGALQESFWPAAEAAGFTRQEFVSLAGELGRLDNAIDGFDTDDLGKSLLNEAAASSKANAELVTRAENIATVNGHAENSTIVYQIYLALLETLPDAEKEAAKEAAGLADAQSAAADKGDEMNSVATSTIDLMTDAEDAFADAADQVDAFNSALDRMIGGHLDVRAAQRDLEQGWEDLAETLKDNRNQLEGNTEAVRANEAAIDDQVKNILAAAEANLSNGDSILDVTSDMYAQRDTLINALIPAFDGSREAAEDYVNQLGLTPENINTTIHVYDLEAQKQRIEDYKTQLGDIPENEATLIQAYIDEGNYAAAEARLAWLARNREINLIAKNVSFNAANARNAVGGQAGGALLTGPELAWRGEDGTEWVAPLTKPDLMERWLQDPAIRNPVINGLGLEAVEVKGGGPDRSGPLVGEMNVYESKGESVEAQLGRVLWRSQFAGARG